MKKTLCHEEKCKSCKGTGLYVGMAELSGSAVVCHRCGGTGCFQYKHEYEPFEGRDKREKVLWVMEVNPGISAGAGEEFGGMSYRDWHGGREFTRGMEMRRFTCPAWWYQSADYKQKPDWDWCRSGCRSVFSSCSRFHEKHLCWERFDNEAATKEG